MLVAGIILLWLLVTVAMAARIRQNRKRYRIGRANRSMRAWVNKGQWYE